MLFQVSGKSGKALVNQKNPTHRNYIAPEFDCVPFYCVPELVFVPGCPSLLSQRRRNCTGGENLQRFRSGHEGMGFTLTTTVVAKLCFI